MSAAQPETVFTGQTRVACDGASDIPGGLALGHPRIWLEIDPEIGHSDCGYCDRRFILKGGPADTAEGSEQAALRDIGDGAGA